MPGRLLLALAALTTTPVAAAAQPAPEPGPKIVVVAVGDPDGALVAAAATVEEAAVRAGLRIPADPGLRAALVGDAGEPDDGLEPYRAARRRLGLDDDRDRGLLQRVGDQAGAVAVAVVRSGVDGPALAVLDVRAGRFYEGRLALSGDAAPRDVARYLRRRAVTSERAAAEGTAPAEVPASAAVGSDPGDAGPAVADDPRPRADPDPQAAVPSPDDPAATAALEAAVDEEAEEGDTRSFLEKAWPYGVAVLLLGAMITIVVLTTTDQGNRPDPILRFVPGGS